MTFLNPLPAVFRLDYVYHLLIIDRALPYKIFPETYHKEIDNMNLQLTDLLSKNTIPLIEIHKKLLKENNPKTEVEKIIEEGSDIAIKEKINLKKKLNDFLQDNNNERDNEMIAFEKLNKTCIELESERFREIPLN